MKVAHQADHINHAVIGANKTRDLKFEDSGHLAHILSSALYSDKPRAVVREVLCNGWDSHIEAGCTDRPVSVTISNDTVTIRDYGTGIADEKMVEVYGTYGGSTKVHDGRQTGGFGLGSKAPFAYVDHFKVTSFHGGKKTVYTISKSSAEVAGKPGITPVVSVPTTETGLEVSFKLKNQWDHATFEALVQEITAFGEMNVLLNGKQLKTIKFSEAKHGFVMVFGHTYLKHPIYVRYGNVIYPVNEHENFAKPIREIKDLLHKFNRYNQYRRIGGEAGVLILQAKPHSISVTPSRESLSMTEHTIASVKELLINFLEVPLKDLESESLKVTKNLINKTAGMNPAEVLISSHDQIPGIRIEDKGPSVAMEMQHIAYRYVASGYPGFKNFNEQDILCRLDALIQTGYGLKGKIQSFRKAYLLKEKQCHSRNRVQQRMYQMGYTNWALRHVIAPILSKMQDTKLDPKRFMVYGEFGGRIRYRDGDYNPYDFIEARNFPFQKHFEQRLLLRNYVVLSYNRMDLNKRAKEFPAIKHWFGGTLKNSLVYLVQRNPEKVDAAREFFKKLGYYIIDLTVRQKWEPEPVVLAPVKVQSKLPPKPRKKGLPRLDAILDNGSLSGSKIFEDTTERIEQPETIAIYTGVNALDEFNRFSSRTHAIIARAFGSKIGVASGRPQFQKFQKLLNNPPNVFDWVVNQVRDHFEKTTNWKIAYAIDLVDSSSDGFDGFFVKNERTFDLIKGDEELAKHFKVHAELSQLDKDCLAIWTEISERNWYDHHVSFKALKALIAEVKPSPEAKKLMNRIKKSELLQFLDINAIDKELKYGTKPNLKPGLRQTIKDAL